MENSLPHLRAELCLENKADRIFYKKKLSSEKTISKILELSHDLTNSNYNWSDIQINFPEIEWLNTIFLYEDHDILTVSYLYPNPELIFTGSNPFDNITNDQMSEEMKNEHIIRQFHYKIWERGNEIMSVFDSEELLVAWDGVIDAGQNELIVNYYYDGGWWLIFEHRIRQIDKVETLTIGDIRNNAVRLSNLTQQIIYAIVSNLTTR